MKTWKKVLIGVGAALVLGIIVAVTVYQSRKNLVTVQTGKVQKQNLASVVSASGEIKPKTYVEHRSQCLRQDHQAARQGRRPREEGAVAGAA